MILRKKDVMRMAMQNWTTKVIPAILAYSETLRERFLDF